MNSEEKMVWGLPRPIWIVSFVGLLINLSTIMVFSLMPTFMESELGATKATVGKIDGFVEFVAYIIRIFSGVTSDIFQNRKLVLGFGYTLSALVKPLFAVAASVTWVFWVRVCDRISNGIQASPRDALIGDLSPAKNRGASYGLTKSLKTAGSCIGTLLAIALMYHSGDNYRLLFNIAFIPALLAVLLLIFGVKEPKHRNKFEVKEQGDRKHFRWGAFLELGRGYWKIIVLTVIFHLAHFGESYLVFRVADTGLSVSFIPLVMLLFNLGQFSVSYPLGWLSDRIPRRHVLMLGFLFMCMASLIIGHTNTLGLVLLGVFLWGAQMGTTQSVLVSLVSDTTPQYIRGTAFGIFYFVLGICILVSSWFAGDVWHLYGHETLFSISAVISIVSCGLIFVFIPKRIKKLS